MMNRPPATNAPIYWRAAVLAQTLGVPRSLLIDDIQSGRTPVPVRMAFFGKSGIAHVMADDARALIQAPSNHQPKAQR